MNLRIQIVSLFFSFGFGIIFSICTNLNYRFLFTKNIYFKVIITFVYILDFTLLYFLLIQKINNGIIHIYFFLIIGIGYLVVNIRLSQYVNSFKAHLKKVLKKRKVDKKEL